MRKIDWEEDRIEEGEDGRDERRRKNGKRRTEEEKSII
jgi:hypothetical protein